MKTTIARINSSGLLTVLQLKEISLSENLLNGFKGSLISDNIMVFNNGMVISTQSKVPLINLAPFQMYFDNLTVDLDMSSPVNISATNIDIGIVQSNYQLLKLMCTSDISSVLPITVEVNSKSIEFGLLQPSSNPYYTFEILSQSNSEGISVNTTEILGDKNISISSQNLLCSELTEITQQNVSIKTEDRSVECSQLIESIYKQKTNLFPDFVTRNSTQLLIGDIISLEIKDTNGNSLNPNTANLRIALDTNSKLIFNIVDNYIGYGTGFDLIENIPVTQIRIIGSNPFDHIPTSIIFTFSYNSISTEYTFILDRSTSNLSFVPQNDTPVIPLSSRYILSIDPFVGENKFVTADGSYFKTVDGEYFLVR